MHNRQATALSELVQRRTIFRRTGSMPPRQEYAPAQGNPCKWPWPRSARGKVIRSTQSTDTENGGLGTSQDDFMVSCPTENGVQRSDPAWHIQVSLHQTSTGACSSIEHLADLARYPCTQSLIAMYSIVIRYRNRKAKTQTLGNHDCTCRQD